jgi:hypothetical protein
MLLGLNIYSENYSVYTFDKMLISWMLKLATNSLKFVHYYFKPNVSKLLSSHGLSIGSWPKNTNASHEIV